MKICYCGSGRGEPRAQNRLSSVFLIIAAYYMACCCHGCRRYQIPTATALSSSIDISTRSRQSRRTLSPPFPNGPCGGKVVTIPPQETYAKCDIPSWMLPPRPISVWLPPNYNTDSSHPILYVHDGNNALEDRESWTGTSWRLPGALVRCADYGLLRTPLPLVVLLPSGKEAWGLVRRRHLEYGDVNNNNVFAQAHVRFVAEILHPLLRERFATAADAGAYTMGSSLGGQAALHLLARYPNVFDGAACLSPAFGPGFLELVENSQQELADKAIYLDIGGDLDDIRVPVLDVMDHLTPKHWWNPGYFWLDTPLQASVRTMAKVLQTPNSDKVMLREFPGARHNERAWAQRIHYPLLHLFGTTTKSIL